MYANDINIHWRRSALNSAGALQVRDGKFRGIFTPFYTLNFRGGHKSGGAHAPAAPPSSAPMSILYYIWFVIHFSLCNIEQKIYMYTKVHDQSSAVLEKKCAKWFMWSDQRIFGCVWSQPFPCLNGDNSRMSTVFLTEIHIKWAFISKFLRS